jgi:hypothetical protein
MSQTRTSRKRQVVNKANRQVTEDSHSLATTDMNGQPVTVSAAGVVLQLLFVLPCIVVSPPGRS